MATDRIVGASGRDSRPQDLCGRGRPLARRRAVANRSGALSHAGSIEPRKRQGISIGSSFGDGHLLHHRRRVVHFNVTDSPTAAWTAHRYTTGSETTRLSSRMARRSKQRGHTVRSGSACRSLGPRSLAPAPEPLGRPTARSCRTPAAARGGRLRPGRSVQRGLEGMGLGWAGIIP